MSASLAPGRYIARETAVSAVINGAISAGFYFAMFGQAAEIAVRGAGGLAIDFLPQSFAVAFFASLVPSLLARRAIARGAVLAAVPQDWPALSLVSGALVTGLLALLLGGGAWAAVLWATGLQAVPAAAALPLKIAYGAALGALATRFHLQRLLGPKELP
jgi:hypothetical protein